jgi:hypothetical protein
MPTRTLYVSDEDATVWEEARAMGEGTDDSMSSIATEGLRVWLRERRDNAADADSDEKAGLSVTVPRDQYTTLINRYRQDLRKYGWERVSLAMTKACLKEGGAITRSEAARKANETRGPVGRSEAARKANRTRAERKIRQQVGQS